MAKTYEPRVLYTSLNESLSDDIRKWQICLTGTVSMCEHYYTYFKTTKLLQWYCDLFTENIQAKYPNSNWLVAMGEIRKYAVDWAKTGSVHIEIGDLWFAIIRL